LEIKKGPRWRHYNYPWQTNYYTSISEMYLQGFGQVLEELVLNHQVPDTIGPLLAASHFMVLHKDPTDPTKLQPISMGSALQCIAGKYIMTV
jgi:hypothetical protein